MTWLLLAALIGVPVYLVWEDRARRRPEPVEDLSSLDLIGCVAHLVESTDGVHVRVVDKEGVERVLPARIEDLEGELDEVEEFLVIEGPSAKRPLLAVPADLPGLENLSG